MAHVFISGIAALDFVYHLDEFPTGGEKYRARDVSVVGGGCAANAAVAVARLGGQADLAARVGRDQVGDMILAELRAEGVNLDNVHRGETARSSFSSIYVTRDGERQIVNFRDETLTGPPHFHDLPGACDIALADTRWIAGARQTIRLALARGIPVVIDAEAPVRLQDIAGATHIAFSRPGLLAVSGMNDIAGALRQVAGACSAWVCVTDGAAGVHFMEGDALRTIPAPTVEAVDTLGAGDTWHGAFALRLAEGADKFEAMRFANTAAALKCTRPGGRAGSPDRAAVNRMIG